EKLRAHLGRFGGSVYELGELHNELEGEVLFPIGGIHRLRCELINQLDAEHATPRPECSTSVAQILAHIRTRDPRLPRISSLRVLCRTLDQLEAALTAGVREVYVDFEDIRRYK